MKDNAPLLSVKLIIAHIAKKVSKTKLMKWPSNYSDKPKENLWSTMKRNVYKDGKQYSSKQDPWEIIKTWGKQH